MPAAPKLGRIVHYFDATGKASPAIIAKVQDAGTGLVNLTVFNADGTTSPQLNVPSVGASPRWEAVDL